jgi:Tfp pilus assembly protein PilE
LFEVGISITIAAILLAMIVPSFHRVAEQSHLDSSAQYLRSIWSAERVYWLEKRTFTTSFAELDSLGMVDPRIITGSDGYYTYSITDADATTFTVTATRAGSSVWAGQITITQSGQVAGQVTGSGSTLVPPDL